MSIIKYILCAVFLYFMVGCKTVKEFEYHEVRDTLIEIQTDTAYSILYMDCDSNYNVVVQSLDVENGKRSHISHDIKREGKSVRLETESVSEGQEIAVEGVKNTKREVVTEYVDKPIPSFYRFCVWWFVGSLLILLLVIGIKVVRI